MSVAHEKTANIGGVGMINEKDRGQLLRMAGNIACGLVTGVNPYEADDKWENKVAEVSARIAWKTLKDIDALIEISK